MRSQMFKKVARIGAAGTYTFFTGKAFHSALLHEQNRREQYEQRGIKPDYVFMGRFGWYLKPLPEQHPHVEPATTSSTTAQQKR